MKRFSGFPDCGLCYGTGLIENLATGARESCWRCAERAARAASPHEDIIPPSSTPRAGASPGPSAPTSPSFDGMASERAANFLRVALWVGLGLAGVAIVQFTTANQDDEGRRASDELQTLDKDLTPTKTTVEYSAWEPAQ
jgi:hypothetical protein